MGELEQFRQTFFEECAELMQQLEEVAVGLQPGANDPEHLDAMFRSVHSIKAGAGVFKFDRLVVFTHEYENVMDKVRAGDLVLGEGDPEILVQAGDILHDLIEAARAGEEATQGLEDESLAALRRLLHGGAEIADAGAGDADPVADTNGAGDYSVRFRPFRSLYETANEPQLLFRALESLGEMDLQIDMTALPELSALDPAETYLVWTATLRGVESAESIREVFEFVEDECELVVEPLGSAAASEADVLAESTVAEAVQVTEAAVASGNGKPAAQASSIRVDLGRVDRLVDMVGELVIAQAVALESLSDLIDIRHVHQLQALEDLTMRTRQLQEGVMAIRMQPLKAVFSRFPRVVRDLSKKLGKQVRLEISGETTEVDKTIIEELSDPLTHMIRNCMDHGFETPEERKAAGKSEEGVVALSAEQRNGRILIRIRDDGRGLNLERVFAKAVENGLVDADAELSKEEIEALIFMPGFSTAAEISDVSGRGVGMDVVRRNIQKLGGRVTVESTPGQGSVFTLALPLTLAVLDGMLVSVAGERYVVPLTAIVETVCPDEQAVRQMPDGEAVMNIRGEAIRLIDVCKALGLSRVGQPEPLRKLAVIVETEFGKRIGLIVDELLGQQQVVIKSLEANYRSISGVAGTAILGDGRVRLILDIDGLAAVGPAGNGMDTGSRSEKSEGTPDGAEPETPPAAAGGLSQ